MISSNHRGISSATLSDSREIFSEHLPTKRGNVANIDETRGEGLRQDRTAMFQGTVYTDPDPGNFMPDHKPTRTWPEYLDPYFFQPRILSTCS